MPAIGTPLHHGLRKGSFPIIAFCGPGRAGKDTCAEWVRDNTALVFKGGCSWTGTVYMAKVLSEEEGRVVTPEEAYARRHESVEMRKKWYDNLNKYREKSNTQLLEDCLAHSDLICGPRDRSELLAAIEKGIIDLAIWVDRPVPPDPTVTYSIDDCHMVLRNYGTTDDLYAKLARLSRLLRLPRS